MTVLPICQFPEDSVLRQKAKKVSRIDGSIERLIDDMIETMRRANGVGLAAPQIGMPLRVIVVQMPVEEPERESDKNQIPMHRLLDKLWR